MIDHDFPRLFDEDPEQDFDAEPEWYGDDPE